MTRGAVSLIVAALLITACADEPRSSTVTYVHSDPAIEDTNYWIAYPDARHRPDQERLLRSAKRAMNEDRDPGPLLVLETDSSIEEVADFYATEYGYEGVSPSISHDPKVVPPGAYFGGGDFAVDERAFEPLFETLGIEIETGRVEGRYINAVVDGKGLRPTVSMQRPYRNYKTGEIVESTLITLSW